MNLKDHSAELEQLVQRVSASVVAVSAGGSAISGFVVKPGHVLTVQHVLERNGDVHVVTGRATLNGEVVGRDRATDLALVRVPDLDAPVLGAHGVAKVGGFNLVVARSRRGNLEVASGITAFTGGSLDMGRGRRTLEGLIKSTATAFRGISGAPLVGAEGALLGVVNGSLSRPGTVALNAALVLETAARMEHGGGLKRGYLGVGAQSVRLEDDARGLLVSSVDADSPAAAAGVLIGDVLLNLDGTRLEHLEDLVAALSRSVGRGVNLEVRRGAQAQTLTVHVTERARRNA
jgi:S1-C subfamily serine protease